MPSLAQGPAHFCRAAALTALLATLGCRTTSGVGTAGRPSPAHAPARPTEAAMEQRAQALAAYSAGVVEQERDNTAGALQHFVDSLEKDPANEELALEVARRLFAREEPQKAYDLLKRSLAQPEASNPVRALFGLACVQLNRLDEAATTYRELTRREPHQLGHYSMLAQIFLQQKQPKEALRVIESASEQAADSPAAWLDLAGLFGRIGQAEPPLRDTANAKARACLEKVQAARPTNAAILRRLADGYVALGDVDRAETVLREAAGTGVPDSQLTSRLAELYLRSGKLPEARKQFQEMARANPANPMPPYFLGLIATEARDFPEAVRLLERALALNPEFETAYADLAVALMRQGKQRDALVPLEKARSRFAADYRREFLAALCHANLKEFDQSRERFAAAEKAAQEKNPQLLDHRFYLQLGSMLESAGRYDDAVSALERALALNPDFDEALNHLGYMWAEKGVNLQIAREMIERAVKAEPENAAYLDSLGWVLFQLKQPAEALPHLEKAAKLLEEPDATVLDHLGDVLQALGRTAEAKAAWKQSLAVEPSKAVKQKLEATP